MVDPFTFFKGLGIMTVIVGVITAILVFFYFVLRTYYYPVIFFIKYKVFRKGYDEADFEKVYTQIQDGMSWERVYFRKLLVTNSKKKAEESKYIYNQITKQIRKGERRMKKNGR